MPRLDMPRVLRAAGAWLVLCLVSRLMGPTRFLNVALCGSLALLSVDATPARLWRTLLFGLGFGFVWSIGQPAPLPPLFANPSMVGALLGLGALAEFALHPPRNRDVALAAWGIPAVVLAAVPVILSIHAATTQDAVLLEADRALGGLPSYAAGYAFSRWPAVAAPLEIAYLTLPIEAGLVLAIAIRSDLPTTRPGRIMLAGLLTGLVGAALYRFCPASGPVYAFPGFPGDRPVALPLEAVQVPLRVARNAMPSLHFAWAWILWRAAGPIRWLRWTTLAWFVGISVGALGMGEHYLIDFVVALPFVVTVEAVVARARWDRLVAGAVVTLAWLIYLGTNGGLHPASAWAAVLATLAVAWWVAPRRPYATGTDIPSSAAAGVPA